MMEQLLFLLLTLVIHITMPRINMMEKCGYRIVRLDFYNVHEYMHMAESLRLFLNILNFDSFCWRILPMAMDFQCFHLIFSLNVLSTL
jgi:hypothetical protein